MRILSRFLLLSALLSFGAIVIAKTPDGKPLVVLIADKPSYEDGPGGHEANAGVLLFAKALAQGAPNVVTIVHLNDDWPSAEELDQADTILLYCDNGGKFLSKGNRLEQMTKEMNRGAGFIALHYTLAMGDIATQAFEWLGGFKQPNWSVNPAWQAHYNSLPKHAVTQGVHPFVSYDEWYFHMRFTEGPGKLTPVLVDVPPVDSLSSACCEYASNPNVLSELQAHKPQTMAWVFERPGGGRSFGFTGGHYHRDWIYDEKRKLLLNAILWTAKVPIPRDGVESRLTQEDIEANLDPKPCK